MNAGTDVTRTSDRDASFALPAKTQVLVVGSGAGGALTASALSEQGFEVVLLEEGPNLDTASMVSNSPEAIARLYRNGGLTPILGNQSIAYVEGRCVGGSTEVNSAFWHRLPPDSYYRWKTDFLLADFSQEMMQGYFEELEESLSVSYLKSTEEPRTSALFRQGIEKLKWDYAEVPRCQKQNEGGSPFAPGGKQSMQRTYIPRALRAGTRLISGCKALKVMHRNGRARTVQTSIERDGSRQRIEIQADHIFLCCGAVQTPALLRRSGITRHIGNNLCIHPMIKAAALFEDDIGAHEEALPIYQVKEFWPTITIGGAVFSPGFLAMILSENWETMHRAMHDWSHMSLYYAASRGMNRGTVRVLPGVEDGVVARYRLSPADQRNLSLGLSYLAEILFEAGAKAVFPSVRSLPMLRSIDESRGFIKHHLQVTDMALSTVHAFSSCPMGENPDLCAADSFGRIVGFDNLYVNDASLIPDSPGVNPQGTTMAIASRNVDHFVTHRNRSRNRTVHSLAGAKARPAALVTGAQGWLGTRLVELCSNGVPPADDPRLFPPGSMIRCLTLPGTNPDELASRENVQTVTGNLLDPESLREFCSEAEGATMFHIAGVVHPTRGVKEFDEVNVQGTRSLLQAAEQAGIKRIVVISSNSPFGSNPSRDHLFDEDSPYNPYMGYGRSKARMEVAVREVAARGTLETVIIRPPWFYGPHQPPRQTLFFKMIKDGRFPILGDGRQQRSMAYVDNICQGMLLAASVEQANGQAYWIADERPYTINEIVETVSGVLKDEFGIPCARKQTHLPDFVGDVARFADGFLQSMGFYQQKIHVLSEMNQSIACSIAKAKRELEYQPTVSLREGMIASVRWCIASGLRF